MTRQSVFTRQRFQQSLPVVVSALLHLLFIAVLSVWLVPAIQRVGIWLDAQPDNFDQYELADVSLAADSHFEPPTFDANVLDQIVRTPRSRSARQCTVRPVAATARGRSTVPAVAGPCG